MIFTIEFLHEDPSTHIIAILICIYNRSGLYKVWYVVFYEYIIMLAINQAKKNPTQMRSSHI